jgi:hypothetical protein
VAIALYRNTVDCPDFFAEKQVATAAYFAEGVIYRYSKNCVSVFAARPSPWQPTGNHPRFGLPTFPPFAPIGIVFAPAQPSGRYRHQLILLIIKII